MRILVTGAAGFVGRHLVRALHRQLGGEALVVPTTRRRLDDPDLGTCEALDITDGDAVSAAITRIAPTHVVHLAGASAPRRIQEDPLGAWTTNVIGTLHLAHAILRQRPGCHLLVATSGLVYGSTTAPAAAFTELSPPAPMNDYAATKAAADLALGALALRGLRAIRLRPFNHTGPGQTEAFAVPGFAAQVARIEHGRQAPVIRVGNLDAVRDFLDVRDVVSAYVQTLLRAEQLPAGQVLNIASGVPRRIGAILEELLGMSAVPIAVQADPARLQSGEATYSVGDAGLAQRLLEWRPTRDFTATLRDVLAYWRQQVVRADARTLEGAQ